MFLGEMKIADEELAHATSINIAACGTSWHAALTGKYMIERLARLPVEVDYASEYRYRSPIADPNALGPVSYTHLDVYKRQVKAGMGLRCGRQLIVSPSVSLRIIACAESSVMLVQKR